MRRLLTKENKRSIKNAYRSNVAFRLIDAAYKDQEVKMDTFRFSPEEIWINCFYGFDQILKSPNDKEDVIERMWNDTFCELRDDAEEAGREFKKDELETATSCVMYSIVACLMASDEWDLIQYAESLMSQIAQHSDLDTVVMPFDKYIDGNFIDYIKKYIVAKIFISEEELTGIFVENKHELNQEGRNLNIKNANINVAMVQTLENNGTLNDFEGARFIHQLTSETPKVLSSNQ